MARQLRIQIPGAYYHVFARGDHKKRIFFDNIDYYTFIEKLQGVLQKYNVKCMAFALMPNHYHLYLKTEEANISKVMHSLNTSYSNWCRAKNQIIGHIFQGVTNLFLLIKMLIHRCLLIIFILIRLSPVLKLNLGIINGAVVPFTAEIQIDFRL
ncbi:MAG: transposase [Candidatus Muiribacteriaceae bacterium]